MCVRLAFSMIKTLDSPPFRYYMLFQYYMCTLSKGEPNEKVTEQYVTEVFR